jgi:hypothetical protein
MPALAGQRIFTVGGTSLAWEDLVLAGCLWGDWPALEARVRDGLACLARLDDLDDDDEDALSEDDVEAAAAEFRYARDLVAAADLEAWLERRGLSVDAWLDFVRRSLLRERWADDLEEIRDEYEIDAADVAGALGCEALCGGLASDLAGRLAARAAIHARDEAGADAAALAREAETLAAAVPEDVLERALPEVPAATRRDRLGALARLEAAWRRFAAGAASPEALRALVSGRRLDWMRVSVQVVVTPDEDVAREIAMCVRVDRRPLAEVAEEAGLSAASKDLWVEDVEGALRDAVVGAQPGEVLGPLADKAGHLVVMVGDKRPPAPDDPAVRVRAERALLARTVDREVANRVTWHETL